MNHEAELAIIRRAYAKQILASVEVTDARIEAAFASVPREAYLGPGPWYVFRGDKGYVGTPDADPVYLYDDVLVGIIPERRLNNGQPSYHAEMIAAAAPQPAEHLVHIGAGTGYYTAIMAELIGPTGKVTAIEFDAELAERAAAIFASSPNVRVIQGDGAKLAFDTADVIYVNAGATRPADTWLDGLADGGRLILPLTKRPRLVPDDPLPLSRHGAVFRIERKGSDYFAKWISPVAVFPCEGGRDPESEAALAEAFGKGGWKNVHRLYRSGDVPIERCWLRAPGWSLAYS